MNFIRELIEGSRQFTHATGGYPYRVFVPRWRQRELMDAANEMFHTLNNPTAPIDCDCHFNVAGMCGRWWNRDYIEYQL